MTTRVMLLVGLLLLASLLLGLSTSLADLSLAQDAQAYCPGTLWRKLGVYCP